MEKQLPYDYILRKRTKKWENMFIYNSRNNSEGYKIKKQSKFGGIKKRIVKPSTPNKRNLTPLRKENAQFLTGLGFEVNGKN